MTASGVGFRLADRLATARLGRLLGAELESGDVLALVGDMGSGKTTLVQSIARGAGYLDAVTSPTYTLIHEYHARVLLVHVDAYRLDRPSELYSLGLADYLDQPCVLLVEWADRVTETLPEDRLTIHISITPHEPGKLDADLEQLDTPRTATIDASGSRSERLLAAVASAPRNLVTPEFGVVRGS